MSEHPTPIVTVDIVVFTIIDGQVMALLTTRDKGPFEGDLALPGGFLRIGEDRDATEAAVRVLREKAGVEGAHVEQFQTFSSPDRDPRGYSLSVAYMALLPEDKVPNGSLLFPVEQAVNEQDLAFDHGFILGEAVEHLRRKAVYSSAPAALINAPFTLLDLYRSYEVVLGESPDTASFRRKMIAVNALEETGEFRGGGRGKGRAAMLYTLPEEGVKTFDRTFGNGPGM